MLAKKYKVSYCIAVYNEEEIIIKNLQTIKKNLSRILGKSNFEIVLVDNGSTDKTTGLLKSLHDPVIKSFYLKKKGHGLGLRKAIQEANNDHIVITAIDIPFGFGDLRLALKYWDKYDIVFGSKAHQESKINNSFQRMIASVIYRFFLKTLFKITIRDTQGSIFLKRSSIQSILKFCTADNAFFTSQIAIWGRTKNLKYKEIPVVMKDVTEKRVSRYKLFKDGPDMFQTLFYEYLRMKKIHEN